jgi:cellulose synthase/poly-beta-1,6-N-acetylglucosamine synthase-like glycosyltransferase
VSPFEMVFWLCAALLAYAYLGYPALLWLGVRAHKPAMAGDSEDPLVSVIVPVHNEEGIVCSKIRDTLALDYPAGRLELIIASDASTDRTDEICTQWPDPRVRLVRLARRGGKARALNAAVEAARGEVLAFTDASILLARDSLKILTSRLSDPAVGCVSSRDVVSHSDGEGMYTRYDMWVRRLESARGSATGMSGSFYAVKRQAFESFPPHVATDLYSALSAAACGHRSVFAPQARAFVSTLSGLGPEFRRKIRTFRTGMAALWEYRRLLLPWNGGLFSLQLWSHKILRWATPFLLAGLLGSSAAAGGGYRWALIGQLFFYAFALLGWAWPRGPARTAAFVCATQLAAVAAWWFWATGRRVESWEPSRRSEAEAIPT